MLRRKLYVIDVGVHLKHQNANSKVKSVIIVVKLVILKKFCKSKSKPTKTNLLEHIPCSTLEVEESDTCFSIDLFDMDEFKATSPIMKQANINGKPMNLQVDTGSSFTIMGYDNVGRFSDILM